MSLSDKAATSSTLQQFIMYASKTTISYQKLSFIEKLGDINFPVYNIVSDYIDELIEESTTITLTEEECHKYFYKPKVLAYELYGSTEAYFIILLINGICNVKEFNKSNIRLLSVDKFNDLITKIYNANIKDIEIYNNK